MEYTKFDIIKEKMCKFVTAEDVKIKPKRLVQANKVYGVIYDIQVKVLNSIKLIEESQLLGMNDVVVDHFINEYKELSSNIKELHKELRKMNQFNEFKEGVDEITAAVKISSIKDFLYNDLSVLDSKIKEGKDEG